MARKPVFIFPLEMTFTLAIFSLLFDNTNRKIRGRKIIASESFSGLSGPLFTSIISKFN